MHSHICACLFIYEFLLLLLLSKYSLSPLMLCMAHKDLLAFFFFFLFAVTKWNKAKQAKQQTKNHHHHRQKEKKKKSSVLTCQQLQEMNEIIILAGLLFWSFKSCNYLYIGITCYTPKDSHNKSLFHPPIAVPETDFWN